MKNKKYPITIKVLSVLIISWSCSTPTKEDPKPIVKPDEPEYIEWSYEAGKDPLVFQLFTFPTELDPDKYFDISDTIKIQNIFEGAVSGFDYMGRAHNLDMTKNSWNSQIFPNVPIKVGGFEFSREFRDELLKGLKLTKEEGKHFINWSQQNIFKIYNEKMKPLLVKKNEEYFKTYNKKPKHQVIVFVMPADYYESGVGGTVFEMEDGNKIVVMIEPRFEGDNGDLEKLLTFYQVVGHEFGGHGLTSSKEYYKEYVGQNDQLGNTVDSFGHINRPAPRWVFGSVGSHHFRPDNLNTSLLFPEENKEFLSAYIENFAPQSYQEQIIAYANLKIMKTATEKSNIPYIANFIINTRTEADKFMKEMWTDKIVKNKNTRVSAKGELVHIKSIISCNL